MILMKIKKSVIYAKKNLFFNIDSCSKDIYKKYRRVNIIVIILEIIEELPIIFVI